MDLDQLFLALSDPSRRAILQRLRHGPATTGQLADLFPISRPAVSQHLVLLRSAGLITTTAAGRHRWHELVVAPLAEVAAWSTAQLSDSLADPRLAEATEKGTAMTQPVTYLEINSPDLPATREFFTATFGWDPRSFAAPDYLVAPHGDGPGVDTGLLTSRDGQPRAVPVIRVDDLDGALQRVIANGGTVVVEPFAIPGVGRGCYLTDPAGVLVGLHHYDPSA